MRTEIHQTDGVHRPHVIPPVHTLLRLRDYRTGRIIDRPVYEVLLIVVLHLHDDLLAGVRCAVDIVYHTFLVLCLRQLLLVLKPKVGDMPFALQQAVEKLYQAVFVYLLTKDVLESPISEGVYKFAHAQLY